MKSIIKLALAATLIIFAQNVQAQETKEERKTREGIEAQEADRAERERNIKDQIATLEARREEVREDWTRTLKFKIETINANKDKFNLSELEVEERKKEAAEEVALNIENQLAIIDNQIALVQRTGYIDPSRGSQIEIGIGNQDEDGNRIIGVAYNSNKTRSKVYDRRTYGELVFSFGLNNAITENGGDIGDEFSIGRSRFFELGYAWKTRVFNNSGSLQLKYGVSLQTNKLFVKDNQRLVLDEGIPTFQEFDFNLDKSQLRFSNLVAPVHLEFGGWRKEQDDDYVRYRISGKFRMGIGGYVGVRLGTSQKLKYEADGNDVKAKEQRHFEGDNLVYGVSSYIRIAGDLSIYGKYELSSAIKTRELGEVNNVSVGLRWDW